MPNFERIQLGGNYVWTIPRGFSGDPTVFPNEASPDIYHRSFWLQLLVAKPGPRNFHFETTVAENVPRHWERKAFVLDTGATYTVITRAVAKELGLNFDKYSVEPLTLADGSHGQFHRSEVALYLCGKWIKVNCRIPSRRNEITLPCQLGMDGLLGVHLFCVSSDDLHAFPNPAVRRQYA